MQNFPRYDGSTPLTAAHINALLDQTRKSSTIYADQRGPIEVRATPGGYLVRWCGPVGLWAALGEESQRGAYAWIEQDIDDEGNFEDRFNGLYGDADGSPALEVNGVAGLPRGTVVWLEQGPGDGAATTWHFSAPLPAQPRRWLWARLDGEDPANPGQYAWTEQSFADGQFFDSAAGLVAALGDVNFAYEANKTTGIATGTFVLLTVPDDSIDASADSTPMLFAYSAPSEIWASLRPIGVSARYALSLGTPGPTAGTFTLTYGGVTTAPIAYNASAKQIEDALAANVFLGANPCWQLVIAATGGTFTVDGSGDTHNTLASPPIAASASADQIATALNATGLGVSVTGPVGGPFLVVRPGGQRGLYTPLMVDTSALTGSPLSSGLVTAGFFQSNPNPVRNIAVRAAAAGGFTVYFLNGLSDSPQLLTGDGSGLTGGTFSLTASVVGAFPDPTKIPVAGAGSFGPVWAVHSDTTGRYSWRQLLPDASGNLAEAPESLQSSWSVALAGGSVNDPAVETTGNLRVPPYTVVRLTRGSSLATADPLKPTVSDTHQHWLFSRQGSDRALLHLTTNNFGAVYPGFDSYSGFVTTATAGTPPGLIDAPAPVFVVALNQGANTKTGFGPAQITNRPASLSEPASPGITCPGYAVGVFGGYFYGTEVWFITPHESIYIAGTPAQAYWRGSAVAGVPAVQLAAANDTLGRTGGQQFDLAGNIYCNQINAATLKLTSQASQFSGTVEYVKTIDFVGSSYSAGFLTFVDGVCVSST